MQATQADLSVALLRNECGAVGQDMKHGTIGNSSNLKDLLHHIDDCQGPNCTLR